MADPRLEATTLFDQALSRSSFTGEFPLDRPASPALVTVPLSWLYGFGAGWYHRQFNPKHAYRPEVPVISVGNLAVGGTGKTPTVIALVRLITRTVPALAQPNRIAVLSRGYGRGVSDLQVVESSSNYQLTGDEPLLTKQTLPDSAVVVHADRRIAARFAIEKLGSRLLIQDDGFQNRELGRDLDLVCVDGRAPLGNGWPLPAGPLREKPEALARASAILGIGTETSAASSMARKLGKTFVSGNPVEILPDELLTDLSTPVFVLVSIARPTRFVNMLKEKGLNIVGGEAFGDHHRFRRGELSTVAELAERAGARAIITTAKDRVRISEWPGPLPLLSADVRIEFREEQKVLEILEPVLSEVVKRIS
jgi:tetraacyldisaccharide 4'-kinase